MITLLMRVAKTIPNHACELVTLLLLGSFACGGESAPGVDAGSEADAGVDAGVAQATVCQSVAGTRLTRDVIELRPGVRQELSIFDTQNEGLCNFLGEEDGSFTCYPADAGGALFFQDPTCTAAIVGFATGQPPSAFQRTDRSSPDGCTTTREFRKIGAASAVAGGQAIFALDANGACSALLAPALDYYLGGPILAPTAFVTAQAELVSPTSRLSGQVLVGNDGSSMCASPTVALDSTLDTACQIRLAGDQETRCVPASSAKTGFFSDAACTISTEAVVVSSCQLEAPSYARQNESVACGAVARHILSVDSTASIQRFELVAATCVNTSTPAENYFPVGPEVDASEFALVGSELEESGGARLQRQLFTSDGFVSFAGSWFDSSLQLPCSFGAAADGSTRCLPVTMTPRGFFSDGLCSAPISLALVDECQAPIGYFAAPGVLGTRMLAATEHLDPVFDLVAGVCTVQTGSFYAPSFEVAPSSFEPGETTRL